MPNSGVFYKDGKFHISKLSSDMVAFAGKVEATGIPLADDQATGSVDGQGNSTESIVLPTATQVVDYVSSKLTASSTALQDELDKFQIAVWGSDIEGNTYSWSNVSSAGRSVDGGSLGSYFDSSGKGSITYAGSSGSWSADLASQGNSLAEWLEAFVTEVKTAFEAAEDGDDNLATMLNTHETALGLKADGTYDAHSAPADSIYAYSDASGVSATALSDINDAGVTNAKLAREKLRSLIQQNYDNFKVLVTGASVDLNILKEIVDAYQLADTEVISAITQIASKTGLSLSNTAWDDYDSNAGTGLPVVTVQELSGASGDSASSNTTKSVGGTSGSASLKDAIESRSDAILVEIAEVQEELDATQVGAGLGADGAYSADAARQYLASASSLKDADAKLDAEIKTINERLSDKHGTESLLNKDAFDQANSPAADFALSASYNVVDALNELAFFGNSSTSALQLELDRTQSNMGIDDSAMASIAASTNKIFAATVATEFNTGGSPDATLAAKSAGDSLIDIITTMRGESDGAFKEIVNAAGFAIDAGTGYIQYSASGSASYVASASSVKDADAKLDAGLVVARDLIDGFWAQTGTADSLVNFSESALGDGQGANLTVVDALNELAAMIGSEPDGSLALDTTATDLVAAINELHTEMGDNDLDFEIYNGASSVATGLAITESETMRFESVAVNLHDNIVLSSTQSGNGVGISIKEEPTFKSMDVDQSVSMAISAYNINVQHEPFVADEAMDAGDVVCIQKGGSRLFGIEKADIGDADKLEILGLAFDPTSTNGVIGSHTFAAGDTVAIVVGKQNVAGVSFASADQSGTSLTYAVGDALYLGVDNNGNNVITKAIPVDDSNIPFDAKAVISLGFVTAISGTNSATENAMWFEPKLVAMEA